MKKTTRRDSLLIIILVLYSIVFYEILLHIYHGFYSLSGTAFLLLFLGLLLVLRYTAMAAFAGIAVRQVSKRQIKSKLLLLGILITAVGLIPKWSFDNVGSILALYMADYNDVLVDTRQLANEYPPDSCFQYVDQRPLCENRYSRSNIPISLRNAYVGDVLILDDYAFLEKFGLPGCFRGYVVFMSDINVWSDDPVFVQGNCFYCWKIRITDGLYWYSDDPSSPSIYREPLD